jgi:hypothetical protein
MSNRVPSEGKPEALVIPDTPEPLDEDDYPEVPYWHEEDWIKHSERQKDHGEVVSRLGFLTDSDGNLVTESRIKFFTSTAKQVWNELYRHRLDPSSWTKKTPKAASYLAHVLKTNFPEFRYCDGDWKVERFAVIKYPDWCRDARESGRLTRMSQLSHVRCIFHFFFLAVSGARPSKRKIGDSNNISDNRRRKRAKAAGRSTAPPGAQVIDPGNGVLPNHSMSSLALPSTATPQDFPSASTAPPSSCLTPQESSTPPIVPTSARMPAHSDVSTLSPSSPNLSLPLSLPIPSEETPPSQVAARENTITADLDICGPPATETALVEQREQVQPRQVS